MPTRTKQLIKTINDLGSVLEAAQRLILQLLGMTALVYELIRAIFDAPMLSKVTICSARRAEKN